MPMVLDGNFRSGFHIELHIKDLMNAIDTAKELSSPAILTGRVLEMLQTLQAKGKGKNDHSGLIQYYEKIANVEVRKKK